jgi:hypothetical protein
LTEEKSVESAPPDSQNSEVSVESPPPSGPTPEVKPVEKPTGGGRSPLTAALVILLILSVGMSSYIYIDSGRRIGDLNTQVSTLTSSVQGLSATLADSNTKINALTQTVNGLTSGGGGSTGGGVDITLLYEQVKGSVVLIKSTLPQGTATGSGFVYDTQGRIVTNDHVIDGANSITVTFIDGTYNNRNYYGSLFGVPIASPSRSSMEQSCQRRWWAPTHTRTSP